MKTASRAAVISLFLLFLPGCRHKTNTAPPQQAQAPAPPPSTMAHVPSLPALPPPSTPDVTVATNTPPETGEKPRPRKTNHHHTSTTPKPAGTETASTQPADKSQTQVAAGITPDTSPIGQLSSTGESAGSGRHDVELLINNTENGLAGIKRTLNSEEQEIATQIKTFLAKAKQALADNDLDGAQTLATKAKVLLEELTKK